MYVEGLNIVKRHQRPMPGRPNAPVGVIEKEGPIHVSNVALLDPKDRKPTRVRVTRDGGAAHARHDPLRHGARLTMARLKDRYRSEIRPALIERFGYSSPMQAPEIQKITLNMGVGEAKQDSKMLEAAAEQLGTIAGQKPNVRRARKSVAAFKLREGMPVGLSVTLRQRARVRVPGPADARSRSRGSATSAA